MSTSIHTCPRCELRFLTVAELGDHLRADHHVTLERPAYRTRLPEPPLDPEPAPPQVDGLLTIPIDPSHPPTGAVRVGATLARQAGLAHVTTVLGALHRERGEAYRPAPLLTRRAALGQDGLAG